MRAGQIRLLDSDVTIDVQRGHPAAIAWYASVPSGSLALPGYVLMELYQSAQNQQQTLGVDRLTASLPLIWPTDTEAVQAVKNFRRLHLSHGIGLVDTLIAATALSLGVPLCTFNRKHFRAIPGLVTEQPYLR